MTLDINLPPSHPLLLECLSSLREFLNVRLIGGDVPWFPRKIQELDHLRHVVLQHQDGPLSTYQFFDPLLFIGRGDSEISLQDVSVEELGKNHPGFNDQEYRFRRTEIIEIGKTFSISKFDLIPEIKYSEQEQQTWSTVFKGLQPIHDLFACRAYRSAFPLLEKLCGYSPNRIPQLQDVSAFLLQCTGWRLKPVTGLLSPRDFLSGLAFRVFHAAQFVRHASLPLYTPEPDLCHELLGHVPLLADPDFAEFVQLLGIASLGATDDDIKKIATIYFFTAEFGVILEGGKRKAYGAGLLSSFSELENAMSDKPQFKEFDPFKVAVTPYPVTEYQPLYFVISSFEDATRLLKNFVASLDRPFSLCFNAFTQCVEVLDSVETVRKKINSVQRDISDVTLALGKLASICDEVES